jgi:DhnA family fructose-bisphosphate aldolase class Ia
MTKPPLRLRRLLAPPSQHAFFLTFTAGLEIGVIPGMTDIPGIVSAFADTGKVSAVVVHAGVVESLFRKRPDLPCGVIIDLFGGTLVSTRPEAREQICSLEHALRIGADGVLATISLGGPDESRHLRLCGQIGRECAAWGMPFLIRISTLDTDARRQYSATLSGLGARMGYELGADAVIVHYPGNREQFADAVSGVAVPVIIGGAPQIETDESLVATIGEAVQAGARGVCLPETMFWREGPTPALTQIDSLLRRPKG